VIRCLRWSFYTRLSLPRYRFKSLASKSKGVWSAHLKPGVTRGNGRLGDFLEMENCWLALARSYEFAERLTDFTAANSDWRRRFDNRLRAAERPDDAPRLPGLLLGLLDRLPRSSGSFAANGSRRDRGSKCNPGPPCPTKRTQRHPGKNPPAPSAQEKPLRSFSTVGGRSRFRWQEGRI